MPIVRAMGWSARMLGLALSARRGRRKRHAETVAALRRIAPAPYPAPPPAPGWHHPSEYPPPRVPPYVDLDGVVALPDDGAPPPLPHWPRGVPVDEARPYGTERAR